MICKDVMKLSCTGRLCCMLPPHASWVSGFLCVHTCMLSLCPRVFPPGFSTSPPKYAGSRLANCFLDRNVRVWRRIQRVHVSCSRSSATRILTKIKRLLNEKMMTKHSCLIMDKTIFKYNNKNEKKKEEKREGFYLTLWKEE